MSFCLSPLRRCVLSVAAVAAAALLSSRGSGALAAHPSAVQPTVVAQRYYPEVRLRKMHLVRPDLIPFPIDFDVYC
jgi:hypothetical protein